MKCNTVIYDCEIIEGIENNVDKRLPNIEYCDGWRDFENMGISVICAYDYGTDKYHVFMEDNFDSFTTLVDNAYMVVGWNNINFDDNLVSAVIPEAGQIIKSKSWDLLRAVWEASGLDPMTYDQHHDGYGLGQMSHVNFSMVKSGYGALAPVDWQKGKRGIVIDYCLNDVYLTKRLFDIGVVNPNSFLISSKTNELLVIKKPPHYQSLSKSQ